MSHVSVSWIPVKDQELSFSGSMGCKVFSVEDMRLEKAPLQKIGIRV